MICTVLEHAAAPYGIVLRFATKLSSLFTVRITGQAATTVLLGTSNKVFYVCPAVGAALVLIIEWMPPPSEVCWGSLQGQQLHIRSFELSILLMPALLAAAVRHPHFGFKATEQPQHNPLHSLLDFRQGPGDASHLADITFWPLDPQASGGDSAALRYATSRNPDHDSFLTTLPAGTLQWTVMPPMF